MILQSQTHVHHFLESSAQLWPDKVALIHEDVRAGYGEINVKANQLATSLIGQGVLPGDRIVILLENGLDYVVAYYGILKAGGVAVPLSSEMKPEGISVLLSELDAKVVISSAKFEHHLKKIAFSVLKLSSMILKKPVQEWSSAAVPVFSWDDLVGEGKKVSNPDITTPQTGLCSIIYTSGSTGKPKGVMLTHGNIVANTRSIVQYLHLDHTDIQMVVLPFFYVMGKSLLNTHFAVGGTVVVNNSFAFPVAVIEQMRAERVTGFSGVPSTYAYLLHRSPLKAYRDRLEALRYCSQAGGHMSRQLKQELIEVLPGHTELYIMYGATEASARLTYVDPGRIRDKIDSIGKPIPGVSVRVLDRYGKEVPVGTTGELVACGENIMQGYWRDPHGTAMALDGNGYHTGDMGYLDEEGYLYLVGRKDNLLKVGGHRVNPQEVEDALMASGLLLETAVVGVPDKLLGHRLAALAVPRDRDCAADDILANCAGRLPRYKLPREVRLVRSLPKNANGKVNRVRCLELVSDHCMLTQDQQ